ncbi:MAG: phosphoribosylglycinamide synthetase C domain-containing protein [Longimicrobiales bacterium]
MTIAEGDPLPPSHGPFSFGSSAAVTTVLASPGYPGPYPKGMSIQVPDTLPDGVTVFHAGTASGPEGLVTSGGRVLAVTGVAEDFAAAQLLSRSAAGAIEFEGKQFRKDIGWREAARLASDQQETREHP